MIRFLIVVALATLVIANPAHSASPPIQQPPSDASLKTVSLDGTWRVSIDARESWSAITVPGTIEDQVDVEFDGVSTWQKEITPFEIAPENRLILQFDAVATEALIFFNGHQVGHHLGGWTPFQCDVTRLAKESTHQPWQIEVICDEKVGHNTQGFLPVFAPHFGGIWKGVRLVEQPPVAIDTQRVGLFFHPLENQLEFEIPILADAIPDDLTIDVAIRAVGDSAWISLDDSLRTPLAESSHPVEKTKFAATTLLGNTLRARLSLRDDSGKSLAGLIRKWSPVDPAVYEVRLRCHTKQFKQGLTTNSIVRFGYRDFRTGDEKLMLNGKPLIVRGLLNWGYAPPSNAPSLDENVMRQEIEFAKARGFNLMKFCLWMPPQRYLELCDELGMLAWIEYPTWHPDFSPDHLAKLQIEYDEFFEYDRNHPSVILRSLTCETGPSADLNVIQALYDQCKRRIPGAVVEDDSSWIAWNRVHDFYDDHPYGNNHSWRSTLQKLTEHIAERTLKPLVLGESIAADTWTIPDPIIDSVNTERPFWLPQFLDANLQWLELIRPLVDARSLDQLYEDSRHYSLLMRKYQIETFRRDVPYGGYVVSVIRDIPFCGMGLIDYLGNPKQPADAWSWHRDTMLLLHTDGDLRSFLQGKMMEFEIDVSTTSLSLDDSELEWRIVLPIGVTIASGGLPVGPEMPLRFKTILPIFESEPFPQSLTLIAVLKQNDQELATNRWPIWAVPTPKLDDQVEFTIHDSVKQSRAIATIPGSPSPWSTLDDNQQDATATLPVLITSVIDDSVLQHLHRAGQVIMLPTNQPGSLPLQSHWFLRGGPFVDTSKFFTETPHSFFVELQHFDLAGDVVPSIQDYLTSIEPIVLLWDNHDLKHVNTHGIIYRTWFDQGGSILVSAVDHARSPAGQYLLTQAINEMWAKRNDRPSRAGPDLLPRIESETAARSIRLDQLDWQFQADADHQGKLLGWEKTDFNDADWSEIRTDRSWEGQGHATLDGWAWYRIQVEIPEDWPERTFINFRGVDDYYRVYANGNLIGSGGDIESRTTAFEELKGHDISKEVIPGQSLQIAVEVYDWYGAGGIFRPVSIDTAPISTTPRMLK